MKIFKTLVVIGIAVYSIHSNAQKMDYIVLNNNDTIYAEKIKGKRGWRTLIINGQDKKIYDNDSIHGQYIAKHDSYYERVTLPYPFDVTEFLKRLTNGRIKLYLYTSGTGTTFIKNLYISKDGSELKSIAVGRMKFVRKKTYNDIRPYLKDSSKALSELDKMEPKQEEFLALIDRYNKHFESQKL